MSILGNLKRRRIPKKSKRRGRGFGSGKGGHTTGSGIKGQNSRSGGKVPIWFEGGQTPLTKRLPYKRGFHNINSRGVLSLNLNDLTEVINSEKSVTRETLIKHGFEDAKKFAEIKILSKGEIKKKVSFKGFTYSKTAKTKIEAAGGEAG